MLQFGIGDLFGNPIGGNASTPSGPVYFGTLQDVSIEVSQALVPLRGQMKAPDDVAPGDMEIKGKAASAKLEISAYNALFFGDTITSGVKIVASKEAASVPASPGPYTVTVTHSGTFTTDLGVLKTDGTVMTKVASGPASGQYSVSAGVYTFNSADQLISVLISYVYTASGSGSTLTVTNQRMGYGPTFEMYLMMPYQNGGNGLHLVTCRSSKLGLPFKRDNYLIPDFEFMAYPLSTSGVWFEWFQVSA